jgi:L-lactate dehydrogenase complex protein LldG
MADQRESMLAAVRRALGGGGRVPTPREGAPPRPHWHEGRGERFLRQLERVAGTYVRVADTAAVGAAAAEFLDTIGQPRQLVLAPHPLLHDLGWADIECSEQMVAASAFSAVVVAKCAVAETGSIVMPSGPQRPTALNLLADNLLVLLKAEDIVDHMEDVWPRLLGCGKLPRTVNFITGPSRTADVEQTIQIGAHGARRVHVILIG